MFYEPRTGHGLPHDPFKAIVAPRPIGWISSVDAEGRVNLAPYSFFNGISSRPPMVMFASEGYKDSIRNIEQTGEFVASLATLAQAEQMNETSRAHPRGVSEFGPAGLDAVASTLVAPPRVGGAPAALECRVTEILQPKDLNGETGERYLTLAEIVGVYIDDACLRDGIFDTAAAKAIARCGYRDYAVVDAMFEMIRPE